VNSDDELWIPVVEQPIGAFVSEIQEEDPEVGQAIDSPRRLLAFRTFAYLRVGLLLGQLLIERDIAPDEKSASWVERLLEDPVVREQAVNEVRTVAAEIAEDPAYADEAPFGPDEAERDRFLEFAKRRLSTDV
jgi:hypothetical protein